MEEIDCYDLKECPGTCDEQCTILTEACCLRFCCGDGEHALNCPKRAEVQAPAGEEGGADGR